jgi:hypothetical protein
MIISFGIPKHDMTPTKTNLPEGFHDLGEELKPIKISDVEDTANSKHYPVLYFSGKTELKDLPKSGTALIKFKKTMEREEETTRNGKTEERYSCELEIHAIKPVESDEYSEANAEEPSDEDAIENGLEAASETKED